MQLSMKMACTGKSLCILFSSGGLGDVGRHAVRAALDLGTGEVSKIIALSTKPPDFLLKEPRWNCACPVDHSAEFTPSELERLDVRQVNFDEIESLNDHLSGCDAVVSCLGNRQPFLGDRVAKVGNTKVVDAMESCNIKRGVFMSSTGIGDDWPPAEWHWGGKFMAGLFRTLCRREFNDLTESEKKVQSSKDIDYLLVRPAGLAEEAVPKNQWQLQKEKYKDAPDIVVAKLDCARFMVQEALHPSIHNKAVVIGGKVESESSENINLSGKG